MFCFHDPVPAFLSVWGWRRSGWGRRTQQQELGAEPQGWWRGTFLSADYLFLRTVSISVWLFLSFQCRVVESIVKKQELFGVTAAEGIHFCCRRVRGTLGWQLTAFSVCQLFLMCTCKLMEISLGCELEMLVDNSFHMRTPLFPSNWSHMEWIGKS